MTTTNKFEALSDEWREILNSNSESNINTLIQETNDIDYLLEIIRILGDIICNRGRDLWMGHVSCDHMKRDRLNTAYNAQQETIKKLSEKLNTWEIGDFRETMKWQVHEILSTIGFTRKLNLILFPNESSNFDLEELKTYINQNKDIISVVPQALWNSINRYTKELREWCQENIDRGWTPKLPDRGFAYRGTGEADNVRNGIRDIFEEKLEILVYLLHKTEDPSHRFFKDYKNLVQTSDGRVIMVHLINNTRITK